MFAYVPYVPVGGGGVPHESLGVVTAMCRTVHDAFVGAVLCATCTADGLAGVLLARERGQPAGRVLGVLHCRAVRWAPGHAGLKACALLTCYLSLRLSLATANSC